MRDLREGIDKPLLFVDIDGVISVFGFTPAERPAGTWLNVDGVPHLISAAASGHLLALARTFDLVWCSGWEEKADEHLPHLLGLPRFPHLSFERNPGRELAHWKLDSIDSYAENRSLAWIDDAFDEACFEWARRRSAPTLLVQTQPAAGLDDEAFTRLAGWADELALRGG